ncbi:DUF6759 domain-containing protein [Chryseobacterium sp. T16E-39]|uniref:DUF6759 domain-containing protein n=1 Tax=Chryseobacterium sp. T16E-39 TaxID=2015076 RepID=UPI001E52E710|nr:DUF6759 domain-containing protein [Chryseobacterium sp. T16E-39]
MEKETLIIYTEQDAESTKEARIIAGFLKQNPNHAKTDYFKRKLIEIIMADNSPEAKPTIKPISKEKIEKIVKNNELNNAKTMAVNSSPAAIEKKVNYASVSNSNTSLSNSNNSSSKKSEPSEESKRTAAMLTHIFSNDDNLKEAYINIKNRSSCNLIVKISGKKYYNLSVPAKGQNFILIDKGEYVLTTMVCDAKYSSLKRINKDIELELNVSE